MSTATLCVSCMDRTGLVAALSDFVFRHDGNIVHADQHTDLDTQRFFMRLQFDTSAFQLDDEGIELALRVLQQRFDLRWQLFDDSRRQRVAVFVSKAPHCLYDLLLRQQMGELAGEVALVVSNHQQLAETAAHFAVPFVHVPVTPDDKQAAETEQLRLLAEHEIDCVVLARYMQILSADFVDRLPGRIINIHHSFLPAFAGARPYHQARIRGVKIIGATAHYVTAELDQGPIIAQDITPVTHRDEVPDLIRNGRDIERRVLAQAVRLHLEHRVLLDGNRTVVFH